MNQEGRLADPVLNAESSQENGGGVRNDSEVVLDARISGRLRAGVMLGLRQCRNSRLRDEITRRLLARLIDRL